MFSCALLSGCSYVLDEPELSAQKSEKDQQNIEVKIQPLTSDVVRQLNEKPFEKNLIIPENDKEKLSENKNEFRIEMPTTTEPLPYKIGIGDVLQLSTINFTAPTTSAPDLRSFSSAPERQGFLGLTTTPAPTFVKPTSKIIRSTSSVSADGSILFLETGPIAALNKTSTEVRNLVNDALIRNGLDTRFQLEIIKFNSQFVSIISYNSPINNLNSDSQIGAALFPITENPLGLRELLVGAGLLLKKNVIELVSIQRDGKTYQGTLTHVFAPSTPNYYLQSGDVVTVEAFGFKQQNAYIMGGRSTPFLIELSEEEPVPLANALFKSGGVLASQASKKSEVYLLRGNDPIIAYHLDATNPARLTISAELELRPNDIVFASTVPVVDLNTILGLINPLRILTGQQQPLFSPAF